MTQKNYHLQLLLIHLVGHYGGVIGDPVRITIHPKDAHSLVIPSYSRDGQFLTDKTWIVSATPGGRLKLHCNLSLPKRTTDPKDCSGGCLCIWESGKQVKICQSFSSYGYVSNGPQITVQLTAGSSRKDRISCTLLCSTEKNEAGPSGHAPGNSGSSRHAPKNSGLIKRSWECFFPSKSALKAPGPSKPVSQAPGPSRSTSGVTDTGDYGNVLTPASEKTSCPCSWPTNRRRIVAGKNTQANEYIFMAYLRPRSEAGVFCGGSILTMRHVLTAAHCLHKKKLDKILVVLGGHNVQTDINNGVSQAVDILEAYSHEYFNSTLLTNDIGLIVVSEDIRFSRLVGPVCFPRERYQLINQEVLTMGWGNTWFRSDPSATLRSALLQVVPLDKCLKSLGYKVISNTNPNLICTFDKRRSPRAGDSGGPLLFLDPHLGLYVQVGIMSFGMENNHIVGEVPKDQTMESAHTHVFSYNDWIQRKIRQYSTLLRTCQKL